MIISQLGNVLDAGHGLQYGPWAVTSGEGGPVATYQCPQDGICEINITNLQCEHTNGDRASCELVLYKNAICELAVTGRRKVLEIGCPQEVALKPKGKGPPVSFEESAAAAAAAAAAAKGAQEAAGAPPPEAKGAVSPEATATPREQAKGQSVAGMIADGWIIPEDESLTFSQGRQQPIDVLVGSNKDEGTFAGGTTAGAWTNRVRQRWGDLADQYLNLYPAGSDEEATRSAQTAFRDELAWHMRLYASLQAKRGNRAYWYFFTHEPPYAPAARNLRAAHAAEIPYIFNNLAAPRLFPDASSPELSSASESERALADRMSSYWVNFARTGDPNGKGLPPWPAFADTSAANPAFGDASPDPMIIGDIKEAPDAERLVFYDKLYTKILAGLGR